MAQPTNALIRASLVSLWQSFFTSISVTTATVKGLYPRAIQHAELPYCIIVVNSATNTLPFVQQVKQARRFQAVLRVAEIGAVQGASETACEPYLDTVTQYFGSRPRVELSNGTSYRQELTGDGGIVELPYGVTQAGQAIMYAGIIFEHLCTFDLNLINEGR